ncbi:MAG TPA: hypothetical protein VI759_04040 [Dehalococcoidia bacterium]|nr:hypothetical protein [Dehalococcoidia bacterium]
MRAPLAVLVCTLALVASACGGGNGGETPTRVPETETPLPATATQAPPTATQQPGVTPTPSGIGGRMHVDIKPRPDPPGIGSGLLMDVRIAAHPEDGGFNRIVFEFKIGTPLGWAEYVDKDNIRSCGPGDLVPIAGTAYLMVHFDGAAGYDENYQPTGAPSELKGPGPSILEAKKICDFEATLVWAIGTSGERPYTVTLLDNPPRVVIDVKNP